MLRFSMVSAYALFLANTFGSGAANAGSYTPLYQFTGGLDGAAPSAALTYDEKGNLYGVTRFGGTEAGAFCAGDGCGTVFKLSPTGQLTTLAIFNSMNGARPDGPLTLINHVLYGSASEGGGPDGIDDGVLFSVHTDGSYFKKLFVFHPAVARKNGAFPDGPLIPGPAGVFYSYAGAYGPGGGGVLFELKPDGTYVHLHDFTGGDDGDGPNSLLSDGAGTLYGTTFSGGSGCTGKVHCGVVFRYVPSTGAFTVLHAFAPGEGRIPMLGSIGPDGTLYGATAYGLRPKPEGVGTLFELKPSGGAYSLTTLYTFPPGNFGYGPGAGAYPTGGPILTKSGALIGTTFQGGPSSGGVLYRFKFNRMENLQAFPLWSAPVPPTLDTNGTIYGALSGGGIAPCPTPISLSAGCGSIYSFTR